MDWVLLTTTTSKGQEFQGLYWHLWAGHDFFYCHNLSAVTSREPPNLLKGTGSKFNPPQVATVLSLCMPCCRSKSHPEGWWDGGSRLSSPNSACSSCCCWALYIFFLPGKFQIKCQLVQLINVISSARGLSALKIEHQSGIQGCSSNLSAHRSVYLSSFVKLESRVETNIALLVFGSWITSAFAKLSYASSGLYMSLLGNLLLILSLVLYNSVLSGGKL